MAGLIIGAGVFALPYAFAKAGIFGEQFILFFCFYCLFLHQWYGEVSSTPKENTDLSVMWKIFGQKAKRLARYDNGSYYFSC